MWWKFPLLHGLFYNIICFTIHERNYKYTNSHFISGMLGGLCVSPLTYITDTFKIKYQTSKPKISSLPTRDNFSSNANSTDPSTSSKTGNKASVFTNQNKKRIVFFNLPKTLASGIYFNIISYIEKSYR